MSKLSFLFQSRSTLLVSIENVEKLMLQYYLGCTQHMYSAFNYKKLMNNQRFSKIKNCNCDEDLVKIVY